MGLTFGLVSAAGMLTTFFGTRERPEYQEPEPPKLRDSLRAAAKNHAHVGVVVDPGDYDGVLAELRADGALSADTRRRLAPAAGPDRPNGRYRHQWLLRFRAGDHERRVAVLDTDVVGHPAFPSR